MFCTGYLPTTATTEWTTFETIGGLQPTPDGLIFRPGLFVEAIESGRWLVIDELNRSNFDRAFGQLFTVLSGPGGRAAVQAQGPAQPDLARARAASSRPEKTDVIRVPANWRIIATMNVFDKNLLFDMSYALMRRFAFIEVGTPERRGLREAARRARARSSPSCSPLRQFQRPRARPSTSTPPSTRPAGPRTASPSRACSTRSSTPTSCRSSRAWRTGGRPTLYRTVAQHLDPPEQAEAQRTIREVLGVELAV